MSNISSFINPREHQEHKTIKVIKDNMSRSCNTSSLHLHQSEQGYCEICLHKESRPALFQEWSALCTLISIA